MSKIVIYYKDQNHVRHDIYSEEMIYAKQAAAALFNVLLINSVNVGCGIGFIQVKQKDDAGNLLTSNDFWTLSKDMERDINLARKDLLKKMSKALRRRMARNSSVEDFVYFHGVDEIKFHEKSYDVLTSIVEAFADTSHVVYMSIEEY
jgi:hypothetical protein